MYTACIIYILYIFQYKIYFNTIVKQYWLGMATYYCANKLLHINDFIEGFESRSKHFIYYLFFQIITKLIIPFACLTFRFPLRKPLSKTI